MYLRLEDIKRSGNLLSIGVALRAKTAEHREHGPFEQLPKTSAAMR
jgi:hypothetical protein